MQLFQLFKRSKHKYKNPKGFIWVYGINVALYISDPGINKKLYRKNNNNNHTQDALQASKINSMDPIERRIYVKRSIT